MIKLQPTVNGDKNYKLLKRSATAFVTIVAIVIPVIKAAKMGDAIQFIGYISFFFFILIVTHLLTKTPKNILPPQKNIFQGPSSPEDIDPWPRPNQTTALCERILKSSNQPTVLVGASGVGKSVMLEKLVKDKLQPGWQYISIRHYDTFNKKFQIALLDKLKVFFPDLNDDLFISDAIIKGINNNSYILFVFDQFENFVGEDIINNYETFISDSRKNSIAWFAMFLANTTKYNNFKHVIVIRKDSYYDLKFLGKLLPHLYDTFHLAGINIESDNSIGIVDRHNLADSFKKVTGNNKSVEDILISLAKRGEVRPVEAQMVGLMLENIIKEIGEITPDYYELDLGGKDGLIKKYFSWYLDASPVKYISIKLLFALSLEKKLKSRYSIGQLAYIIHETVADVNDCLNFFIKDGLIIEVKEDITKYEIVHDYLAESFREFSGSELDPIERDNILFFIDKLRLPLSRPNSIISEENFPGKVSDCILGIGVILLVSRLLCPLYNIDWSWWNPAAKYQSTMNMLDIYYLPCFITHFVGAVYVTQIYKRLFSRMKEDRMWALFSFSIVLVGLSTLSISLFLPTFWIATLGLSGFPVGLKFFQLSKTVTTKNVAKDFRSMGVRIMGSFLLIGIAGYGYFYISQHFLSQQNITYYTGFSYFIMIAMVLLIYFGANLHVSKTSVAKLIGLFYRGTVPKQGEKSSLIRRGNSGTSYK